MTYFLECGLFRAVVDTLQPFLTGTRGFQGREGVLLSVAGRGMDSCLGRGSSPCQRMAPTSSVLSALIYVVCVEVSSS